MTTALVLLLSSLFVFQLWPAVAMPDCTTACGDVNIPYPFGLASSVSNCPKPRFLVTCNNTFHPPRLMLGEGEVINISFAGQITMLSPVSYDCYKKTGERIDQKRTGWRAGSLLRVSDTENKFTTLGCDSISNLTGLGGLDFQNGCSMSCVNQSDVIDGFCSGIGCCQTPIPKGLGSFEISLRSFQNHTKVYDFNPCSYAFIAQSSWFNFSKSYLSNFKTSYTRNNNKAYYVPVVWDWALSQENCDDAQKNMTTYACHGSKSKCVPSKNGLGYSCICSDGYQGNPYLEEGNGGCS